MVDSGPTPLRSACRNAQEEGIVNLLKTRSTLGREWRRGLARVLCGQNRSRDLLPELESVAELLPIRGRGKPMPTGAKVLGDGAIDREEALRVARGLEP